LKTLIKNITTIQTGFFAKPAGSGEIAYLQFKDFDEYGQIRSTLHPELNIADVSEKHLLKQGDVLFAAKGTKNFAAVFYSANQPAVASTSFFVLRLTVSHVLPEYLTWYLNNPSTQTLLKGQAMGTSIASISKTVLEDLEITVPVIESQKAILQITKLRLKEKVIKQQIEVLREQQIQHQINNLIK